MSARAAAPAVRDDSHPLLGHHKSMDSLHTVHLRSLARRHSLHAPYELLAAGHGMLHAILRLLGSVLQHRSAPLLCRLTTRDALVSGGALVSSAPTKHNTSTPQHLNINTSTPQHLNTSTSQPQHLNTSTSQHLNFNTSTSQPQHHNTSNLNTSTPQHNNIP